ncbi:MAG: methyltransferase domain-containing protein, partial [Pirellulales bacterium]
MKLAGQRERLFDGACSLCRAEQEFAVIAGSDTRRYYHCDACSLIFVDPRDYLSPPEQIARYRTHQNSIHSAGYVAFLRRIVDPMLPYLDTSMRGLDFGCGPGPTLSLLVERQGIACANYDPFFAPNELQPPYDFIFATECFEHFTD